MKLYARYLRKSRAEEGQDLQEVLSKHKKALDDLAEKQNIVVSDTYEEIVSGESIALRPQMLLLLDAVEQGKYAGVLCMDIDRLGRGGMRDQGLILDTFRASNTLIITPDKTYDLNDDSDEQMTEFKAFFARQEYKMIRKRMRRGVVATLESGGYISNPPFGYRQCRVGRRPSLEIVEEEAKFVRMIFDDYAAGSGMTAIADKLNRLGAKTRRGAPWSRYTVRYILTNPVYLGKIYHNRRNCRDNGTSDSYLRDPAQWIVADGLHPPIITKAQWDAVQQWRKNHYQPTQYDGKAHHPLTGLLVCAKCGRRMQLVSDKNDPYLYCSRSGCMPGTKETFVETALLEALDGILTGLKQESSTDIKNRITAAQEDLKRAEAAIVKCNAKRDRLYGFLEDGTYDKATFTARMSVIEGELYKLQAERRSAEEHLESLSEVNREIQIEKLESALSLYGQASHEDRNRLLKSIISYVEYRKEKGTAPRDFHISIHLRSFM